MNYINTPKIDFLDIFISFDVLHNDIFNEIMSERIWRTSIENAQNFCREDNHKFLRKT